MIIISEAPPSQRLVHFNGCNFEIPQLKESQNLKHYFGGDIQKFSQNLQGFIWAKYKGEKHLLSYNYLGPGTRLHIRTDEYNNPKQGKEPINAIDHLAYIHDLAYQNLIIYLIDMKLISK